MLCPVIPSPEEEVPGDGPKQGKMPGGLQFLSDADSLQKDECLWTFSFSGDGDVRDP